MAGDKDALDLMARAVASLPSRLTLVMMTPEELAQAVEEGDAENIEVCSELLEADTPVEMLHLILASVPKGHDAPAGSPARITTH